MNRIGVQAQVVPLGMAGTAANNDADLHKGTSQDGSQQGGFQDRSNQQDSGHGRNPQQQSRGYYEWLEDQE
jgi:hypothetical protein